MAPAPKATPRKEVRFSLEGVAPDVVPTPAARPGAPDVLATPAPRPVALKASTSQKHMEPSAVATRPEVPAASQKTTTAPVRIEGASVAALPDGPVAAKPVAAASTQPSAADTTRHDSFGLASLLSQFSANQKQEVEKSEHYPPCASAEIRAFLSAWNCISKSNVTTVTVWLSTHHEEVTMRPNSDMGKMLALKVARTPQGPDSFVVNAEASHASWNRSMTSTQAVTQQKAPKIATCVVCDETTKSGARFCMVHKRAYESIYRDSTSAEARSNGCFDKFQSIFGDELARKRNDPPQPSLMLKVLTDFVAQNPDGKS
eukprot:2916012-Amphidinium_carterae.1